MKIKTHWEKIADLEFYTEGPVLDEEGNLYFSTLAGGSIMQLSTDGSLSSWASLKCPNGQRILENGHHLVCDTHAKSIVELDREGKVLRHKVHATCSNRPFDTPNDLIMDEYGGFYFTDSVRYEGQVFYVGKDGKEKLVFSDLDFPNGIALSPDGLHLFVAESYTNRILVAEVAEPGVTKGLPEVFVDLPSNPHPTDPQRMPYTANLPDGIAFDNKGRLWVAHYGMGALQVVGVTGHFIDSVPTGIPATSNLCFASDYNSIFVTGGSGEPGPGMIHQIIIKDI